MELVCGEDSEGLGGGAIQSERREKQMPKALEHALIWEEEHQQYQLSTHGQPQQGFHREDEAAFSRWVAQHSSFAFVGQAGRLSVLHEARGGGTGYWYAYRTKERHTHKRYLGSSSNTTAALREEEL